ncbi:MAG: B12-binding domain-containing radical SAM protein, partial [Actinomycetota bacterium]
DERYRADLVVPRSATDLAEAAARSTPGLYLFSDYVWNVAGNLALSAAVKEADPHHLTVHGGPSVPGYEADRRAFLDEHPSVDVLVHGEGEITIRELLGRLAHLDPAGPLDAATACEAIAGLAGTTVRTGEGPVTGPARDRIEDLASVPSPFLTGVFDDLVDAGLRRIVLETNRGCPFRCSFCDWGSATNTRIRTFPLDRVEAEIEWAAANRAEFVIMADANFGMLPRDEQITEWVAGHHESTGFPVRFGASMAKNPNDRFASIIERMRDAGLLMGAGLSLQTYDPGTLDNIDRRNIPRERYDGIWDAFRSIDVPMGAEFMIGLPGCTRETFRDDLQFAVDREVSFLVHRTAVLPNAPMNDPDYRDRFGLVTDADHNLIATESYSPEDLREMLLDYQAVYGADHLGTLRVVLRFLRQRTGRLEADLAVELAAAARSRPAHLGQETVPTRRRATPPPDCGRHP